MINLETVKEVCFIAPRSKYLRGVSAANHILPNRDKVKVVAIPTDGIKVNDNDTNGQLMEKLGPLIKSIASKYDRAIKEELDKAGAIEGVPVEHKVDPRIVFLIDSSDRTGVVLARLFQGPWGGFPFAGKHTLVMNL